MEWFIFLHCRWLAFPTTQTIRFQQWAAGYHSQRWGNRFCCWLAASTPSKLWFTNSWTDVEDQTRWHSQSSLGKNHVTPCGDDHFDTKWWKCGSEMTLPLASTILNYYSINDHRSKNKDAFQCIQLTKTDNPNEGLKQCFSSFFWTLPR